MRRIAITALLLLMSAAAAFAQDANSFRPRTELSVFASNLGYTSSELTGSRWTGGVGVALAHTFMPHWAAELAVADEGFREAYPTTEPRVFVTRDVRVFPVDAFVQYRFTNDSRWTQYVAGGVRYVRAPLSILPAGSVPVDGFAIRDRTSAEIGFGTSFAITRHVGFRVDLTRLLRNDSVNYDPLMRTSFGFDFRF